MGATENSDRERARPVEAERPAVDHATAGELAGGSGGLAAVWGPAMPTTRAPRILGLFAHPDDEVFCVGGTIARCAEAGAVTAIASLTQGEAGQIRDATTATRRSLGPVRAKELQLSASALGVDHVTCLDLGDGHLSSLPLAHLAATARSLIEEFLPDVVVTFGPDGGFGHPDHIASCLATVEAVRTMAAPPRLLHAKFPIDGELIVDLITKWLKSQPERFRGTPEFGHALKLFADGTTMLGVAAGHVRVEWFPTGSYIIEQDEVATELYCILSGTADVIVERDDGQMQHVHTAQPGSFFGEDGLASGRRRNAHVIARDPVTCVVLSAGQPSLSAGRGTDASVASAPSTPVPAFAPAGTGVEDCLLIDVKPALDRKIAALAAHRSQYAQVASLLPRFLLERLLGTERFVVADR